MENIQNYYSKLAKNYDENRFGNSYGQFIHARERSILSQFLPKNASKILDIGCGTGRLTDLATDGLDQSQPMLDEARKKWPLKHFTLADARKMPIENEQFQAAFCLHVLMHLPENEVAPLVAEAARILQRGGIFIVDFPSKKRRRLLHFKASGWHGATSFDLDSFKNLIGAGWKIRRAEGLLLIPIHRFSPRFRSFLSHFDAFLGKTFLKNWSSYLFIALEKI